MKRLRKEIRSKWAFVLLAIAVLFHALMMGSLFWGYLDSLFDNSASLPQGIDFFSVYEAGHSVLENRSVYHFDGADTSVTPHHNPFRYLPLVAYVVAVPFNALPAWEGYWTWVAINELLLVLNAYLTWRVAGRSDWALVAASMWFVFTPFYVELYVGQFSFLMATLLLLTGLGLVRGRELRGGLPWAVSIVTKSNSALLLPLLIRVGWWRAIAGGAVLVALNAAYFAGRLRDLQYFLWINLSQVLNGGYGLLDFQLRPGEMRFFEDPDQRLFQFSSGEHGLLALVRNSYLAFDSTATNLPGPFSLVLVAAVVGVGLGVTFFSRRLDVLALFGVWICTFFLVYTAWEHHYVMLLPALVLLVAFRPASRWIALVTFAFVAMPSPYWLVNAVSGASLPPAGSLVSIQESWPAWGVVLHHAAKPLPVLALWAHLAYAQVRNNAT